MLTSLTNRVNTFLLVFIALLAVAIIAILASRASAGPLDPPGPPASTMHTLDDVYGSVQNVPQSWDKVLDSTNGAAGPIPPAGCNSDRFKCVMGYSQCSGVCVFIYPAVLDEETGLVWQRAPDTAYYNFSEAMAACEGLATGNRHGWRLPTMAELGSLGAGSGGSFPSGNPFSNISTTGAYWTSTEDSTAPTSAFLGGFPGQYFQPKVDGELFWCVRGATGDR